MVCFFRIREKQLRESYILKYGDQVKGMKLNQVQMKVWCIGHTQTHVDVTVFTYTDYV